MKRAGNLTESGGGSSFRGKFPRLGGSGNSCDNRGTMSEPQRKYRWPWLVLAAVLLGIALAVFWVGLAAKKVAQQRDFGVPLPAAAPAR
jgi:hypothetical protein